MTYTDWAEPLIFYDPLFNKSSWANMNIEFENVVERR